MDITIKFVVASKRIQQALAALERRPYDYSLFETFNKNADASDQTMRFLESICRRSRESSVYREGSEPVGDGKFLPRYILTFKTSEEIEPSSGNVCTAEAGASITEEDILGMENLTKRSLYESYGGPTPLHSVTLSGTTWNTDLIIENGQQREEQKIPARILESMAWG